MKFLDEPLLDAVRLLREYMAEHVPGGSIRLVGDQGTLVIVTQDPDVTAAVNAAFDPFTDSDGYEELTGVNVKDTEGEC